MVMLNLPACRQGKSEIGRAVEAQLVLYPESTLQDIYKSFFQDEFGPGHLLNDTAGARQYLDYELSEMSSSGHYMAEPCGTGKNFYRVPLDLVKDGKIPFEAYYNAFIRSAAHFRTPDSAFWELKWKQIVDELERMNLQIKDFEKDKASLEQMLEDGGAVVHHSEVYSKSYDPHYRIMGEAQWKHLAKKYSLL